MSWKSEELIQRLFKKLETCSIQVQIYFTRSNQSTLLTFQLQTRVSTSIKEESEKSTKKFRNIWVEQSRIQVWYKEELKKTLYQLLRNQLQQRWFRQQWCSTHMKLVRQSFKILSMQLTWWWFQYLVMSKSRKTKQKRYTFSTTSTKQLLRELQFWSLRRTQESSNRNS